MERVAAMTARRILQTPIAAQPGLVLIIEAYGAPEVWHDGEWRVYMWDWNVPHHEFPDFDSREEAKTWAEREFLILPDAWEECDAVGCPSTVADIIRRVYPRRLTCAEAAAVAWLCYHYEFVDRVGRPIFPGDERCITSFNVVADVMDTLDWDRDGCDLFPAAAGDSYGFVADVSHYGTTIDASIEFHRLWDAVMSEGTVGRWSESEARQLPPGIPAADGPLGGAIRLLCGEKRYPAYEPGYLGYCLGLTPPAQVVPLLGAAYQGISDYGDDARFCSVTASDSQVDVILQRRRLDGTVTAYLTGVDARLRKAVVRPNRKSAAYEASLDDERERFAEEVHAWVAWRPERAAAPPDVPIDAAEAARLIAIAEADDAGLDEAVAFLRARHVFVAEAMHGAPPHVVRRIVLNMLRSLTPQA